MRIVFASKDFVSGQQVNFKIYDQDNNEIFDGLGQEWGNTGIYYIDVILSPLLHYIVIAEELSGGWKATKYILGGLEENLFITLIEDALTHYFVSDIDVTGTTKYYGYLDKDGNWYIIKELAETFRFVKGVSDYTANWTNRVTLTYKYFNEEF